jgi:hypothetical protein
MNIRDTNWLLFPSDMKHCWKTLSYDRDCICDSADCSAFIVPNLIKDGSYKIYRNENGRWLLEKQENVTITSGDYVNPDYRDFYRI